MEEGKDIPMTCSICNGPIATEPSGWDGGRNAEPITDGRCCADCDGRWVTTARLWIDNLPSIIIKKAKADRLAS